MKKKEPEKRLDKTQAKIFQRIFIYTIDHEKKSFGQVKDELETLKAAIPNIIVEGKVESELHEELMEEMLPLGNQVMITLYKKFMENLGTFIKNFLERMKSAEKKT